jgi:hypothetical protein
MFGALALRCCASAVSGRSSSSRLAILLLSAIVNPFEVDANMLRMLGVGSAGTIAVGGSGTPICLPMSVCAGGLM